MDNLTSEQRKKAMSSVRGKDTKPEILVRSLLHKRGFRFRKNVSSLPGKPDIVLPKYKTIIFIHGCFWHQHENCHKSRRPTSRVEFWNNKLDKNIERDRINIKSLIKLGWRILVVWECEIKDVDTLTERLIKELSV